MVSDEEILQALREMGSFTRKDFVQVCLRLGLSYWSARDRLAKLLAEGKIVRVARNKYRLAEG